MDATGALARIASALALVLLTFNPSGHSYCHWLASGFPHVTAAQVVVGLLLLIGWVVYVTATLRSLGLFGVTLLLAVIAMGLILGVGMCWSFVRRRLSGQTDVDEVHGS